jgi:glycosyltransferase involved in cell wall biosynthesis
MKIMLVVARLNVGGVALNVVQLAEHLRQMPDVEVLLVNGLVGEQEGDMQYLVDATPLRQVVIPTLGRELSPLRDVVTLWQLWRLMRQFRPDVVHTHTAKAGFVGRWAAWLARVPVRVHTFHGHVFHGYFGPGKTRLFLWLERLSARISTRIFTLSQSLMRELAEDYRVAEVGKFEIIPQGLDLTRFAEADRTMGTLRASLGLSADLPIIAVIGRLVPIKNHRLFVEAAALLHEQRPNVRFVIVGDGELRAAIEADIAARNLTDVILMAGWARDILAVVVDCDVVTITSDNEGTPVSLIEAIAANVPVVSTTVGGVHDLLGADLPGQLVPPDDAQALCDTWRISLDSPPDLRALRAHVLETYTIERIAAHHLKLFRALLGVR